MGRGSLCPTERLHSTDLSKLLRRMVELEFLEASGKGRWTRYKLRDSLHKDGDSLHIELLQKAAPARKNQRLAPKEMETIILELCQDRWLSRLQLSQLLDRNMEGLRQRFLAPMAAHGLLRLKYPDSPNRPDQAYTKGQEDPQDR